jgi:hypothetical protein
MPRKRSGRAGARFALGLRWLGATALFVALLGFIVAATAIDWTSAAAWNSGVREFVGELPRPTFAHSDRDVGLAMIFGGLAIFVVTLLFLGLTGVRRFAARRSAVATNAALQTTLAVVLLVAVNVVAFHHYVRYDWTGRVFNPSVRKLDHFPYVDVSLLEPSGQFPEQFTLPPAITDELQKLRAPTTIVVYQRHKTFGQTGEKPDAYDYAAERKVVEKVQDLVEQFREFGPQFRVEVLDVEAEGYDAKLDKLTRDAPALRAALDAAPDNSLFFHARREVGTRPDGKPDVRESVQRLSFTDFFQLDKTASLGKSVVVLLEKRRTTTETGDAANLAPNTPAANITTDLARVKDRVKHLVDPEAKAGPDYRVYVAEAGEPGVSQVLEVGKADYAPVVDRARARDETAPLRRLIDNAEDNCVLVYTDGRARRYGFRQFSELDDTEARDALRPRGNLVLLPQGVESFARKVLALNERKPRVGIAVVHELLTTEGYIEPYTMAGVRKALELHGFEVMDVVLKKWGGAEPQPVAYTAEENKLEGVEEDLADVDASQQTLQAIRRQRQTTLDKIKTASLDELTRAFRSQLGGRPFTEAMRKDVIDDLTSQLEAFDAAAKQNAEARRQLEADRLKLGTNERVIEERRTTDLKAKMAKLLAECDLLIVPRLTQRNLTANPPDAVPAQIYSLGDVQVETIKEFMKAGKPVLACFGPANEPPDPRAPAPTGPDGLEKLLGELGIQFGKQTVLFNSESRAFAERRTAVFGGGGAKIEIPPVKFGVPADRRARLYDPAALPGAVAESVDPNPIAESMTLVARNLGPRQSLDLELRHPRPVYFVPVRPARQAFSPEFLVSDEESWNEDQPFPTRERTPRFEPPKSDDPAKGTRDEKRRGPFPLGVAVETTVPAEWTDPRAAAAKAASLAGAAAATDPAALTADGLVPADAFAAADKGYTPTMVRVAAIGHGGLFNGPDLSPGRERLLLTTCNWLLGRDERLPHPAGEWAYPRVTLSRRAETFWTLTTLLALPGLFGFLGVMVLTARRFR